MSSSRCVCSCLCVYVRDLPLSAWSIKRLSSLIYLYIYLEDKTIRIIRLGLWIFLIIMDQTCKKCSINFKTLYNSPALQWYNLGSKSSFFMYGYWFLANLISYFKCLCLMKKQSFSTIHNVYLLSHWQFSHQFIYSMFPTFWGKQDILHSYFCEDSPKHIMYQIGK